MTQAAQTLQHTTVTPPGATVSWGRKVLIGATPDGAHMAQAGSLQAARLVAIKKDIERSLDGAGLSVAAIAARHGLTPRCVQRLFEAEGTTFTAYVVSRRLARAHGLLGDPRHAAEKIIAVAHACGFGDVSYFNRVFRRHFGLAPSDVRAQAREEKGSAWEAVQAGPCSRGPRRIGPG